jgi:putative ABC transport system ATP-binding protein
VVHGPQVVFADEPTGSLDAGSRLVVMDLLVELARAGSAALVVVTHDGEVAERCGRVLTLCEGRLVASDGAGVVGTKP